MPTRTRLLFASLALLVAAAVGAGCGYSLAGRGAFLPARVRIIGVPMFTNQTPYFDLEQLFTERVRSELIGRGRYTILPEETGVDAVLTGRIVSLAVAPVSFTQEQQASRYVVTITAGIELRDTLDDQILWQNPALVFRDEFDSANVENADNPEAFFGQSTNAMQRLSTEFARTVVSSILEAF
jgi:outer membrane lipopolysaccharide assembly protein LptE/RlpB